jgi:hypothetical protein
MRATITTICLLFAMTMATPVTANIENCEEAGAYASAIMFYRQQERSFSKIMTTYEDIHARGDFTDDELAWAKGLILSAYEDYKAKYSDDGRLRITNEFRNKVELECYKEENK